MNDYTKNISQSIFTPGIHQVPTKGPQALRSHFKRTKQGTGTLDGSQGRLFDTNPRGVACGVAGKIGAKYLSLVDGARRSLDTNQGTSLIDASRTMDVLRRPKSSYNIKIQGAFTGRDSDYN